MGSWDTSALTDPFHGLSGNSFNYGGGGGFMGIPGTMQNLGVKAKQGFNQMTGNDPWNFAREAGVTGLATLATGGLAGAAPLLPGIMGGLNGELYGNWAAHDKFLKHLEAYKAMQARNASSSNAGASGVSGSIVGANSNMAASNAMIPAMQARRQAMMGYQADIMDQIQGWLSMMGYAHGNGLLPFLGG